MINNLGSIGTTTTKTEQIDTKPLSATTVMMQNQTIASNTQHHSVMQHIGISQSNSISQQPQQVRII